MSQLAVPAGGAARAAVLLESLAPSPGLSPNAASNETDWGAAQGPGAGSASPNSSSPVTNGGGGGGSGTPAWQTGLLTVLVAAAVILAVVTMFMLITARLRRQRRQVLAALSRIQRAELADLEAADLAAARRWHAGVVARAMERRSRQQPQGPAHQAVDVIPASGQRGMPMPGWALGGRPGSGCPAPPPVVVVHPDLGIGLCTKEAPAVGGGAGRKRRDGAPGGGGRGLAPSSPAGAPAPGAAPRPATGGEAAGAAAVGEGAGVLQGAAAAAAAAEAAAEAPQPLPRLPVRLQRVALEFPGLGAAVLLLLPHQHGWLVWHEGSSGQAAAPRGPLPPMTMVEVRPEEVPGGGGAELAEEAAGGEREGPHSGSAASGTPAAGRAAGSEGWEAGPGSTQ